MYWPVPVTKLRVVNPLLKKNNLRSNTCALGEKQKYNVLIISAAQRILFAGRSSRFVEK